MSKHQPPRELCRFQIAEAQIIISEYDYWLGKFEASELHFPELSAAMEFRFEHVWLAELETIEDGVTRQETVAMGVLMDTDTPVHDVFIAVRPEWRRQGLGTVMLQQASDLCRRYRIPKLRGVPQSDWAKKMANRDGFDETADGLVKEIR